MWQGGVRSWSGCSSNSCWVRLLSSIDIIAEWGKFEKCCEMLTKNCSIHFTYLWFHVEVAINVLKTVWCCVQTWRAEQTLTRFLLLPTSVKQYLEATLLVHLHYNKYSFPLWRPSHRGCDVITEMWCYRSCSSPGQPGPSRQVVSNLRVRTPTRGCKEGYAGTELVCTPCCQSTCVYSCSERPRSKWKSEWRAGRHWGEGDEISFKYNGAHLQTFSPGRHS